MPIDSNNSHTSNVDRIFNKLAVDFKSITVQRLGKPDGKIRPLKISLRTPSEVFKIFSSSRLLKSDTIFNEIKITRETRLNKVYIFKTYKKH